MIPPSPVFRNKPQLGLRELPRKEIHTAASVAGGDETTVLGGKSASAAAKEAGEDGVADIAAGE